ncbi:MAG: hypothetical protein AAF805_02135, partial [Planctomycetota bacterium]
MISTLTLDGGIAGGLDFAFARGVESRDESGHLHAPGVPRFAATPRLVAQREAATTVLSTGGTFLGPWAGRDRSGADRVFASVNQSGTLTLYDPSDWSVTATRPLLRTDSNVLRQDLLAGLPNQNPNRAYELRALVDVHGSTFAYCQVDADLNADPADRNWTPVGSAVLVSHDAMASWSFCGVAGSDEWPEVAAWSGESRGQIWGFNGYYPDELDADGVPLSAWLAVVDYQNGAKRGGQLVLYRLTRLSASDPWTVSEGRVLFQLEVTKDTHFHTAGV